MTGVNDDYEKLNEYNPPSKPFTITEAMEDPEFLEMLIKHIKSDDVKRAFRENDFKLLLYVLTRDYNKMAKQCT